MYFYENGSLRLGDKTDSIEVDELARQQVGPTYIYDLDDIEQRYEALAQTTARDVWRPHYAMKANSHPVLLRRLGKLGAGMDTVSAGEIRLALNAGVPADRIIFSGVGKTRAEIGFALESRIKQINVESPEELLRIRDLASQMGVTADVVFRMNPDVNPKTHPYITTGFRENKFGMDESFVAELTEILRGARQHLKLRGLSLHIGSLLFDLEVMREAIEKTIQVYRHFRSVGFEMNRLDVGGGLGVRYDQEAPADEFNLISDYRAMVNRATVDLRQDPTFELLTEPGRILVARSGLLVCEVQYIKKTPYKTFAIVDSGMNHLLRPALYGAAHRILKLRQTGQSLERYDVVGPICESSDSFAKGIELEKLTSGDRVGIADVGAYGYSMSSEYNSHARPNELVISKGRALKP